MLVQWLYRNDSEESCSTQELIDWDAAITAEDRDILEATDADACVDTTRKRGVPHAFGQARAGDPQAAARAAAGARRGRSAPRLVHAPEGVAA